MFFLFFLPHFKAEENVLICGVSSMWNHPFMYLLQDLTKCSRKALRGMLYHMFLLFLCPWAGRSETVPGLQSTELHNSEQAFTTQQYTKGNGSAIVSSVSSNASFRKAVWEQITLIEPLGRSNCDLKFCFFSALSGRNLVYFYMSAT